MKRKLLFAIAALLCSVGMWAQTWHDITSKITNPSFETGDMTGWTAFGDNNDTPVPTAQLVSAKPLTNAVGDYVCNYQWWCWSANGSIPNGISQSIGKLPAGTYKLTAIAGAPTDWTVTLYANDESASTTMTSDYSGETLSVTFTLSATTELTIKAIVAAGSNVWQECNMRLDNFKLYSYGEDYTDKLKNTGFESDNVASGNVSGYNAPNNWSIQNAANGGAGIATYGAAYKVNSQDMPASPGSEYGNNGFMFRIAWGGNAYIYQEVTLPAGYYELGYSAQAIFANSKKTILKSTSGFYIPDTSTGVYGQVQDLSNTSMSFGHVGINLTEETTVQVRIGYQAQGYGSGNSTSVVFDNITLVRYESEYQALAAANSSHPIDVSYKLKGDALTAATWSYDDGTHDNWQTTKNVNNAGGDYYWGSDNNTTGANYFEAYISGSSKKAGRIFYQSIDNVYAGSYSFRAAAMANTTGTGVDLYVGNGKITVNPGDKVGRFYTATGSISNYPLELGLKQDAATTNWFAIAQTGLFYNGATLSELKTQFNTLAAILDDGDYDCVTGSERTAVSDIVNDTYEDDKAVYMEAIDNLKEAIVTFKAAKSAYEKFDREKDRAIAIGVSSGSIIRPVSGSASDLRTALQALYVQEDAAASSGYTVDATGIFGSWVPQNTGSGSGQHWSGDGSINYIDKWSGSGFTMSVTNTVTLPAGSYVFKAAARAAEGGVWDDALTMQVTGQTNAIFDPQGDSGKGIDTSGAANYGDGTFTNSGAGRGWEWRFIPFTLDSESEVTMKVEAIVKGGNWASFSDITLLTTDDNIGICQRLWSAAKDAAIAARDNDDYAIVTGKERTDLAAAISEAGTEPETSSDYQTQTAALNNSRTALINAKGTYTEYAQESVVAAVLGVDVPAINSSTTTAAILISNMQAMNVSEYTAATTGYTFDATELLGDWSNAPGTNKGQSWDGSADDTYYDEYSASARAMTQTVTLPKAKYVLMAKGRASTDGRLTLNDGTNTITFPHKSGSGKGITTAGVASFSDGTFADDNNGCGWEYRFLTFESDGSTSTALTFNWTTASSNWAGLDDITLLAIPETVTIAETDDEAPIPAIANVTLTRTLAADKWNTFSVPFDFTVAGSPLEGARVMQFNSADDNIITMEDADEVVAGDPYLVKPTSDIVNPTFEGVDVENPAEAVKGEGDYKFQAHLYSTALATDGTIAYLSNDGVTVKRLTSGGIKGLRSVFQVPEAALAKALVINFGDADGIMTLDAAGNLVKENATIYNLAGQRMSKTQKGVNIVNGKKVLVK